VRTTVGVATVVTLALVATLAWLVVPLGGPSTAAPGSTASARLGETTYPLLDHRGAADPTVVQYGEQWVAISTGPWAPRAVAPSPQGPWTDVPSALASLPPWALAPRIWASDLVDTGRGWLLYFSAPVAGLGPEGRCIGVATAATPLEVFVPQQRPLVCPRRAVADPAYDIARPVKKGLPKSVGVIDPEGFQAADGKRYVLYRTQRQPSSIRIVAVPRSGRGARNERDSVELIRRRGVVENPVLVQRGKFWVMFTSQNYFGGCNYDTTWRKAQSLAKLFQARKHQLLDKESTGLCGPGGADLLGDSLLFFHAWTCPELATHCPFGVNYDRTPAYGSHRAMFGATLAWSAKAVPRVESFLVPAPTPAPDPAPDPAPADPTSGSEPQPAI